MLENDRVICSYPYIPTATPIPSFNFFNYINSSIPSDLSYESDICPIETPTFPYDFLRMIMWGYIVWHFIETLYYQTIYLQQRYYQWFNSFSGQSTYMLNLYGLFVIFGIALDQSTLVPNFMVNFIGENNIYMFYLMSSLAMYSCFFSLLIEYDRFRQPISQEKQITVPMKHIFIFRGVPGVGKTYSINKLEQIFGRQENPGTFRIISQNKYFRVNSEYRFERELLGDAERWQMGKFLKALKEGINRIYISNINNERDMYKNYEIIGKKFGYRIRIVELPCENERELFYFHRRNKHNQPYKFSKQVYDNWEIDTRAEQIEPYIAYHESDCLPEPVRRSRRILDRELREYMGRRN
jgi:hypothetical protein